MIFFDAPVYTFLLLLLLLSERSRNLSSEKYGNAYGFVPITVYYRGTSGLFDVLIEAIIVHPPAIVTLIAPGLHNYGRIGYSLGYLV